MLEAIPIPSARSDQTFRIARVPHPLGALSASPSRRATTFIYGS